MMSDITERLRESTEEMKKDYLQRFEPCNRYFNTALDAALEIQRLRSELETMKKALRRKNEEIQQLKEAFEEEL